MLIRSILSICIVFLLTVKAFGLSAVGVCNDFAQKTVKSDSLHTISKYLQAHPKDFLANFCYGQFYSRQTFPYNQNYNNEQYYPIRYYLLAIQYTKNPQYKALAYMQIASYYINNNGEPQTIYSNAKKDYYLNKAITNAIKSKDKELILNVIYTLIESGNPLEIGEYSDVGNLYAITNSDKNILYTTLANRYDSLKDYNKALYYNLQALRIQIKEKMFFNILNGLFINIKNDMLKTTDVSLTQQTMNTLISMTEFLQTHPKQTVMFDGTRFTYTTLTAMSYNDIGDLLYTIQKYKEALLNYKASYILYNKVRNNDAATQEFIKIKNTQKAIYYKGKQ